MRSLRIFVDGIELDYVREDLNVREENNSFSENLKVSHSTRPVRIVENTRAVEALGDLTIATANKRKYFDCKIEKGGIHYNGILTQIEKMNGFRKCDVKFGSALNGIMEKKIASFFPSFSFVDPAPPYSKESDSPHGAGQAWTDYAAQIRGKIYPEVKWQLPQLNWKHKFGTDLKPEDAHYDYLGAINYYMIGKLVTNRPAVLSDIDSSPYNATVIAPQVFLLSPLHYAFESLGYVLSGNFVKDSFFRRLLLLSFNDNMTKVIQKYPGVILDIDTSAWEEVYAWNMIGIKTPSYAKRVTFLAEAEGNFVLRYFVEMFWNGELVRPSYGIAVFLNGERIAGWNSSSSGVREGQLPITITAEQVGMEIEVRYISFNRDMPDNHKLEFAEDLPDLEFHDQHPTVDFSRYIPDWTVAGFLENIKNTWNLKIDIDDVKKQVAINFNEADYLHQGETIPIMKSLQVVSFNNIASESYLLKFANDKDAFRMISKEEFPEQDENTTVLTSKFKYIPHNSTAELSDAVKEKEGVGLTLMQVGSVETTGSYMGRTLSIPGEGGIFNTYWRSWLLFRINAANATLKGPFSKTELYQISQKKKIYIDNQLWLVKAINYKENAMALFETELEVESVTF